MIGFADRCSNFSMVVNCNHVNYGPIIKEVGFHEFGWHAFCASVQLLAIRITMDGIIYLVEGGVAKTFMIVFISISNST